MEQTRQFTEDKKAQARNLYLHTTLTQSQIAELLDVSQKTISLYISESKLQLLKKRAAQSPSVFLEQMNNELHEMNEIIASRPPGQRVPTLQEAEIRRKTMYSIATIRERQSAGTHIEVLINFLQTVFEINIEHAKLINRYVDEYVTGELKVYDKPRQQSYSLPAEPVANAIED